MRYLLLSFFLLAATVANSQVGMMIFGGPQVTYSHYTIQDKKQENKTKTGFQLGAGIKVPFDYNLFFTPLAFYSLKGYKVTFNLTTTPPDAEASDNNTTLHTFELSPLLQYDFSKKPGHFFLRAGPSVDLQLYGRETYNRFNNTPVSRKMKFSYIDYGHFGFSVLVHAGYEMANGFSIYGQYSHGIGSINNGDNGPKIFHRAAGISISYLFNRENLVTDTRNKE